jgi:hypothetical protein
LWPRTQNITSHDMYGHLDLYLPTYIGLRPICLYALDFRAIIVLTRIGVEPRRREL